MIDDDRWSQINFVFNLHPHHRLQLYNVYCIIVWIFCCIQNCSNCAFMYAMAEQSRWASTLALVHSFLIEYNVVLVFFAHSRSVATKRGFNHVMQMNRDDFLFVPNTRCLRLATIQNEMIPKKKSVIFSWSIAEAFLIAIYYNHKGHHAPTRIEKRPPSSVVYILVCIIVGQIR